MLEPDPAEAEQVRELYRLYIVSGGAKAVARELNRRGVTYRTGVPWDKTLVLNVLAQTASLGTYGWGKSHANAPRPREDWLSLSVEPIVDADVYALAQRLRSRREPARSPGRAAAKPHLLTGLVWCKRCGASYQLETSGKKVDGAVYRYCYSNCRRASRAGAEVCAGFRIPTEVLDAAVLAHVAEVVCFAERVTLLATSWRGCSELHGDRLAEAWRTLVTTDPKLGRAYLLHLVERIDIDETCIVVTGCSTGRSPLGGRSDATLVEAMST